MSGLDNITLKQIEAEMQKGFSQKDAIANLVMNIKTPKKGK